MSDGRAKNGGRRPGSGRKPKPIENAQHSVLLELFNTEAEREVVQAQINRARTGDTTAATWLWDRKYGKVKDQVEQSGEITVKVIRVKRGDSST